MTTIRIGTKFNKATDRLTRQGNDRARNRKRKFECDFVNLTGSASAFVAKLKHWKRVTLPLAYHLSSQMMTIAVYINTCIHVFVFIFLWASFSMFSGVSVSTSFSHQSPVFLHLLSPLVSQYLLPSFKKISLNLAPLLLSLVVISSEKEVSNQFLFGWRKSPNVWRDENNVDTFLFMFHWIGLHCTRASRKISPQSKTIVNNSSLSLSRTLFIRTNGYAYFLVLATVTAGALWPIRWELDNYALGRKGKILHFKYGVKI